MKTIVVLLACFAVASAFKMPDHDLDLEENTRGLGNVDLSGEPAVISRGDPSLDGVLFAIYGVSRNLVDVDRNGGLERDLAKEHGFPYRDAFGTQEVVEEEEEERKVLENRILKREEEEDRASLGKLLTGPAPLGKLASRSVLRTNEGPREDKVTREFIEYRSDTQPPPPTNRQIGYKAGPY